MTYCGIVSHFDLPKRLRVKYFFLWQQNNRWGMYMYQHRRKFIRAAVCLQRNAAKKVMCIVGILRSGRLNWGKFNTITMNWFISISSHKVRWHSFSQSKCELSLKSSMYWLAWQHGGETGIVATQSEGSLGRVWALIPWLCAPILLFLLLQSILFSFLLFR